MAPADVPSIEEHKAPGLGDDIKQQTDVQQFKNVYIKVLANYTGDIWHVAAASILAEYVFRNDNTRSHPFPNVRFVPCLVLVKRTKDSNPDSRYEKNGKDFYEYLQSIGVPCAVVAFQQSSGDKRQFKLTYRQIDDWYAFQQKLGDDVFVKMAEKEPLDLEAEDPSPEEKHGLVELWCSTTIVMQLMQYLGVENAQALLAHRLSLEMSTDSNAFAREKAREKFNDLIKCIAEVKASTNCKKILLLNYRLGEVNRQHDTNSGILEHLKEKCKALETAVISIPHMARADFAEESRSDLSRQRGDKARFRPLSSEAKYDNDFLFDMLDVRDTPALDNRTKAKLDGRTKAYFWRLVAERLACDSPSIKIITEKTDMPDLNCVVGLIGGRSGSTDLPSFVGLNTMSWEEPLFNFFQMGKMTLKNLVQQGPQVLRLLNQWPVMRVCWLSPTHKKFKVTQDETTKKTKWTPCKSHDKSVTRGYARLYEPREHKESDEVDELERWLMGDPETKPCRPIGWGNGVSRQKKQDSATKFLETYMKHIETESINGLWSERTVRISGLEKFVDGLDIGNDDAEEKEGEDDSGKQEEEADIEEEVVDSKEEESDGEEDDENQKEEEDDDCGEEENVSSISNRALSIRSRRKRKEPDSIRD